MEFQKGTERGYQVLYIGTNDKIDLCVRAYQTADSRLGVPFAIKACFHLLNFHIRLQPQNEV